MAPTGVQRYLEEAWKYVIAVRPWRVRFACAVPVFIGVRTLILLGDAPENRLGIKVSRNEVRRLMVWAAAWLCFGFWSRLLTGQFSASGVRRRRA